KLAKSMDVSPHRLPSSRRCDQLCLKRERPTIEPPTGPANSTGHASSRHVGEIRTARQVVNESASNGATDKYPRQLRKEPLHPAEAIAIQGLGNPQAILIFALARDSLLTPELTLNTQQTGTPGFGRFTA